MVVWRCRISLKAVSKNYNNITTNINHHNNIIIVTASFLGDFL